LSAADDRGRYREQVERHSQAIASVSDWGTPIRLDPESLGGEAPTADYAVLEAGYPTSVLAYAKYYHDYTKELIARQVQRHLKGRQRATILELGCGHGMMAPFLLGRIGGGPEVQYLMTDVIEDSMRKSAEYFRQTGFDPDRVVAFTCNGECLPFADGSIDLIVVMEAIEHFERPHLGFREFHRVLRPGGLCLITTPRPSQSFYWLRIGLLDRIVPYRGFVKHLMVDYSLCDENFHKYIRENGFSERSRRFYNVCTPFAHELLIRLLHFPVLVRLYAALNLRLLSRLVPLFRRAQFRALVK
jgi:ubiquinone/menaquinone biosynthesis C-methylase UbiE